MEALGQSRAGINNVATGMVMSSRSETQLPARELAVAFVAGFISVALQRTGVVAGSGFVSFASVGIGILVVVQLVHARRVSGLGLALWLALGVSMLVATVANPESSAASGMLMLAIHGPLLILGLARGSGRGFFHGVLFATVLGALMAGVQVLLQTTRGGSLWDPLGLLPEGLLISGFNTQYAIVDQVGTFGLAYKPNGVVFLEPSFLSFYCGLSLTLLLIHRTRPRLPTKWLLVLTLVLSGGLVLSLSTSGVLLLAVGLVVGLVSRQSDWRLIVVVLSSAVISWRFGLLDGLYAKLSEGFNANTSTGLRLALPYELLVEYAASAPLFGLGPGSANDYAESTGIAGLQTTTSLKLAIEYGLLGVGAMMIAVIAGLAVSRAPVTLTVVVLVAWLVPAEALTNASVSALVFWGLFNWAPDESPDSPGPESESPPPNFMSTAG